MEEGQKLKINSSSHLTHKQIDIFVSLFLHIFDQNEMLLQLDPSNLKKVALFLQILVSHSIFRYI